MILVMSAINLHTRTRYLALTLQRSTMRLELRRILSYRIQRFRTSQRRSAQLSPAYQRLRLIKQFNLRVMNSIRYTILNV